MGNRMCKKNADLADGTQTPNRQRSFKGIISKWNLKPRWKSDSHLNKQRLDVEEKNAKNKQQTSSKEIKTRPLSKSTDWTEVPLVAAADAADNSDVVYVKNAQLSMIFNDNHTPTPPPRKHHKKPIGLREKIKAVAKQGLQAVQSANSSNYSNRKPVDEPLCVKKIINYCCPHCEAVSGTCHRHRAQEASQAAAKAKQNFAFVNPKSKSVFDRKTSSSSTNSLPTQYGDGKLSIAIDDLEDIDGARSSIHSLPGDNNDSQPNTSTPNSDQNNKIMSRARSFGSLLPQILLHKLSTHHTPPHQHQQGKAPLAEIESDDSFGGLEDWDIGLIEHYNPKDASLPRGVKGMLIGGRGEHGWGGVRGGANAWRDSLISNEDDILASLEGMIVNDIEEPPKKPEVPNRKSESLLKKITRENSNRTINNSDSCQQHYNHSISVTPPPSPEKLMNDPFNTSNNNNNNNHKSADHSTLMKIIEDYKQDEGKSAGETIDLYRNLSTEEALTKSISKTTANVDTICHSDVTRKSYTIQDDLSKFDSPNVHEFKRMSVIVTDGVNNNNSVNASLHNDFLNAERRFITETDLNTHGKMFIKI